MLEHLIWPSIVMSLAFIFYTAGVWGERFARDLKLWHVIAFWLGLTWDAYGTWLMKGLKVAGHESSVIHDITGTAALALMLAHAIWATYVALFGTETARRGFHRYSLVVWLIWLIPYFGGMIAGISGASS
ncbi:MAG: TIGR03987 family protein [Actinobacteria bacterium]|nr:TIGR03987 family protein [Actinomycetota bacterium]